jgi:hypothetical protein
MADFVIVVATLAAVASGAVQPGRGAVPDKLPVLGFQTYPSLEACEEAAASNPARPGTRLVCLPIEPLPGTLFSAH